MTRDELEADYYVAGFYSRKHNVQDVYLQEDSPVQIAVNECRYRVLSQKDGISINFENAADETTCEIALSHTQALRLIEKIAERINWSRRGCE